jgi:hypothetical protein
MMKSRAQTRVDDQLRQVRVLASARSHSCGERKEGRRGGQSIRWLLHERLPMGGSHAVEVNAHLAGHGISSRWSQHVLPECEYAAQLAGVARARRRGDGPSVHARKVPGDIHSVNGERGGGSVSWEMYGWWWAMEAYSKFHQMVVDGECAPRYLVFRASGAKGLGNKMMALTGALLAAMVSDRAFLIHWLDPVPLTR